MSSPLLAAASFLFFSGAYLAVGRTARERAGRLKAGMNGEARVARSLPADGQLDNVLIQSRPGQEALIDHIVRGSGRLLIIETKNWNGSIAGGTEGDWTQTRPNGQEVVHRNPIMQAKRQKRILSKVTGLPVIWVVVMAGRCQASSGTFPDGVLLLEDVSSHLGHLLDGPMDQDPAPDPDVNAAWSRLLAMTGRPEAKKELSRSQAKLEAKFGKREWLGYTALAIASACVAFDLR